MKKLYTFAENHKSALTTVFFLKAIFSLLLTLGILILFLTARVNPFSIIADYKEASESIEAQRTEVEEKAEEVKATQAYMLDQSDDASGVSVDVQTVVDQYQDTQATINAANAAATAYRQAVRDGDTNPFR